MTGLDRIIENIASQSQAEADRIIAQAEAEAKRINDEAYEKAEIDCKKIVSSARSEAALMGKISTSGAKTESRKRLLAAQRKIEQEVIDKALSRLRQLPDDEYFGVIKKLCVKYARGNGELLLSKADKKRLPSDFTASLNRELSKKGASLTVAEDCAKIDGGFILRYGGIEENCSFSALAEEKRDDILDRLNSMLFSNRDA